jgi:hypothetical protein
MATTEDDKREKANARRRETNKNMPTGKPIGRPPKSTVDLTKSTTIPKLMIIGRGQLGNRAMHALRLTPEIVERLRGSERQNPLVAGPLYLVVEYALRKLIEDLETRETPIVIRAEDLG